RRRALVFCLALTLLGGCGFMVIKTIEYHHKYVEHVFLGAANKFSKLYKGDQEEVVQRNTPATLPVEVVGNPWIDPNAGTPEEARIKPTQIIPAGLAAAAPVKHRDIELPDLPQSERDRLATFFNIYFL